MWLWGARALLVKLNLSFCLGLDFSVSVELYFLRTCSSTSESGSSSSEWSPSVLSTFKHS